MNKITNSSCRKCGGDTYVQWQEPEKSSGMDIKPLERGGMERICRNCGFTEFISDLESKIDAKDLPI
jgi:predicted nucleic-acid-binding Zn-ribbon protein